MKIVIIKWNFWVVLRFHCCEFIITKSVGTHLIWQLFKILNIFRNICNVKKNLKYFFKYFIIFSSFFWPRRYALKDKKMFARAKGVAPQILLELNIVWNQLRAAVRALEPKEEKLVQQETKFKRQIFLRNVTRLKSVIVYFLEWGRFIQYV